MAESFQLSLEDLLNVYQEPLVKKWIQTIRVSFLPYTREDFVSFHATIQKLFKDIYEILSFRCLYPLPLPIYSSDRVTDLFEQLEQFAQDLEELKTWNRLQTWYRELYLSHQRHPDRPIRPTPNMWEDYQKALERHMDAVTRKLRHIHNLKAYKLDMGFGRTNDEIFLKRVRAQRNILFFLYTKYMADVEQQDQEPQELQELQEHERHEILVSVDDIVEWRDSTSSDQPPDVDSDSAYPSALSPPMPLPSRLTNFLSEQMLSKDDWERIRTYLQSMYELSSSPLSSRDFQVIPSLRLDTHSDFVIAWEHAQLTHLEEWSMQALNTEPYDFEDSVRFCLEWKRRLKIQKRIQNRQDLILNDPEIQAWKSADQGRGALENAEDWEHMSKFRDVIVSTDMALSFDGEWFQEMQSAQYTPEDVFDRRIFDAIRFILLERSIPPPRELFQKKANLELLFHTHADLNVFLTNYDELYASFLEFQTSLRVLEAHWTTVVREGIPDSRRRSSSVLAQWDQEWETEQSVLQNFTQEWQQKHETNKEIKQTMAKKTSSSRERKRQKDVIPETSSSVDRDETSIEAVNHDGWARFCNAFHSPDPEIRRVLLDECLFPSIRIQGDEWSPSMVFRMLKLLPTKVPVDVLEYLFFQMKVDLFSSKVLYHVFRKIEQSCASHSPLFPKKFCLRVLNPSSQEERARWVPICLLPDQEFAKVNDLMKGTKVWTNVFVEPCGDPNPKNKRKHALTLSSFFVLYRKEGHKLWKCPYCRNEN